MPPRRNVLPSTSAASSPARGSGSPAARSAARRSADRAARDAPCSATMSSGVAAAARVDHLPHRRILLLDLRALRVAEHLDVQQQRLLDLGRVEQPCRGSRARSAGDRAARSPRRRRASSAGVREHRERVDAVVRALERGDEAPAGHAQHRVGGEQRAGQRAGAIEPAAHDRAVLDPQPHLDTCPPSSALRDQLHADDQRRRPPAGRSAPASRQPRRASAPTIAPGSSSAALRLVALAARRPGTAPRLSAPRRRGASQLAAQLEVVERAGQRCRVDRRVHDPERRRGRVLGRARRVGIQRVALQQQ